MLANNRYEHLTKYVFCKSKQMLNEYFFFVSPKLIQLSWQWFFCKPDSKIKQQMLSVSIPKSNWYISFSSHRITTTGTDCKTIKRNGIYNVKEFHKLEELEIR